MTSLRIGALAFCLVLLAGTRTHAQGDSAKLIAAIKASGKDDLETRRLFAELAGQARKDKAALKSLLDFLDSPLAKLAAQALSDLGPEAKEALPTVLKQLRDPAKWESRGSLLLILEKSEAAPSKEIVDTLIEVVKDDGKGSGGADSVFFGLARETAVRLLGKMGPETKAAAPVVLEALKEATSGQPTPPKEAMTGTAPQALANLEPDPKQALPVIQPLTESKNNLIAKLARKANLAIGKDPAEIAKVVDKLVADYKNKQNRDRYGALVELKSLGPVARQGLPGLLELLDDKKESRTILDFITELGPPAKELAVPALLKQLQDKDRLANEFLLFGKCLQAVGADSKDILAAVNAVLEDSIAPDSKVRAKGPFLSASQTEVFRLLQALGPNAAPAVPALIGVVKYSLQSQGPAEVLRPTLETLAALGPAARDAAPVLEECKASKRKEVLTFKDQVQDTLGKIGGQGVANPTNPIKPSDPVTKPDMPPDPPRVADKPVNAELLKGLGAASDSARDQAVVALLKMGEDALPTLKEGMKSEVPEVRLKVVGTLGKLGAGARVPPALLMAALKDPSPQVRRQAAVSLAALGPAAREAEAALAELLQDSDRELRLLAAYALEKIQEMK